MWKWLLGEKKMKEEIVLPKSFGERVAMLRDLDSKHDAAGIYAMCNKCSILWGYISQTKVNVPISIIQDADRGSFLNWLSAGIISVDKPLPPETMDTTSKGIRTLVQWPEALPKVWLNQVIDYARSIGWIDFTTLNYVKPAFKNLPKEVILEALEARPENCICLHKPEIYQLVWPLIENNINLQARIIVADHYSIIDFFTDEAIAEACRLDPRVVPSVPSERQTLEMWEYFVSKATDIYDRVGMDNQPYIYRIQYMNKSLQTPEFVTMVTGLFPQSVCWLRKDLQTVDMLWNLISAPKRCWDEMPFLVGVRSDLFTGDIVKAFIDREPRIIKRLPLDVKLTIDDYVRARYAGLPWCDVPSSISDEVEAIIYKEAKRKEAERKEAERRETERGYE